LFVALHYGFVIPREDLPRRAACESDCAQALTDALAKGWLQILDPAVLAKIATELHEGNYLGPIYGGLPPLGCVDLTVAGADLWQRYSPENRSYPFAYLDVVYERTSHFFPTLKAAERALAKIRQDEDFASCTQPERIGPWRPQWWRTFPSGYRVEVEHRRQWQGLSSGVGENCYLDLSPVKQDLGRLLHVLSDRHMSPAEYLLLRYMEDRWSHDSAAELCWWASQTSQCLLGTAISREECQVALDACLRKGWLGLFDPRLRQEIAAILDEDPAEFVLLEKVEFSATKVPVEFTPAGARLYREVSAAGLGADWEDALHVSRGEFWEAHYYCEVEAGFDDLFESCDVKGSVIHAARTVPIGPWCVSWWKRFPIGFRRELILGRPGSETAAAPKFA